MTSNQCLKGSNNVSQLFWVHCLTLGNHMFPMFWICYAANQQSLSFQTLALWTQRRLYCCCWICIVGNLVANHSDIWQLVYSFKIMNNGKANDRGTNAMSIMISKVHFHFNNCWPYHLLTLMFFQSKKQQKQRKNESPTIQLHCMEQRYKSLTSSLVLYRTNRTMQL